jgi:hypothetical protein
MPLSINKLEKLLTGKGLLPKKYFAIHGLLVYLEVLSIANADSFMLYIPSKYEIKIAGGNDVYKAKYIEISEDGHIPGDYAGEPDNFDLEKAYDEVDIDLSPDTHGHHDMAGHLEENYNHPVSLKDISKSDTLQLREIFRQLRRLKFCVQSLKYKLCIMFKDYLCCIRRDDTFEGYVIHHLEGPSERKLLVSLDLETLYEKIDSVSVDIKTVREGIYRVLDKNQSKHIRNLQKMLEQKNDLTTFSDVVLRKKTQYATYLSYLEQLLSDLGCAEKKNIENLMEVEERYSDSSSLKGLHMDIERSHQVAKYETELSRINVVKQELIRNILMVKIKHEDLALKVDKICFDNTVMIDAIVKNFVTLSEL